MRKRLPISEFARPGRVVFTSGALPAYIYAFEEEFCLIRTRGRDGSWSELRWIESYDGPLVGSPTAEVEEAFRLEAMQLASSPRPPLPQGTSYPRKTRFNRSSLDQPTLF